MQGTALDPRCIAALKQAMAEVESVPLLSRTLFSMLHSLDKRRAGSPWHRSRDRLQFQRSYSICIHVERFDAPTI